MKKSYLNNLCAIRFRQWSRKGYAVFSGLNKNISIGHVSADVCEKSLVKSSPFLILNNQSNIFNTYEDDEQEIDAEWDTLSLLWIEILQINKDIAARQHQNNYIKLLTQG